MDRRFSASFSLERSFSTLCFLGGGGGIDLYGIRMLSCAFAVCRVFLWLEEDTGSSGGGRDTGETDQFIGRLIKA